jgi:hypothetical protein
LAQLARDPRQRGIKSCGTFAHGQHLQARGKVYRATHGQKMQPFAISKRHGCHARTNFDFGACGRKSRMDQPGRTASTQSGILQNCRNFDHSHDAGSSDQPAQQGDPTKPMIASRI